MVKLMLAKVIKLSNERGGAVSVKSVIDYLTRDPSKEDGVVQDVSNYAARDEIGLPRNSYVEGGTFNLEGLGVSDPADRDLTIKMMDYISKAGQQKTHFNTNPIYHYSLAWQHGEHPDLKQVSQAVEHSLKALGLEENQTFFVIHRDKEHHHVHVIANRVHPEKLTLSGPPRFDYLVLDKASREIEVEQGWKHSPGPFVVMDGEIRRLTKKQRNEMGLGKEQISYAPTPSARMFEVNNGTASFASWAREKVATDLDRTSWQSLHDSLAKHGIRMDQRGGGLVLITQALGRETSTKASGVDYKLSLGRLQKQLGAYQPSTKESVPQVDKTYTRYIESVMTGREGDGPGKTGKGIKREAKRVERHEMRDGLIARYKSEKIAAKSVNKKARDDLSERHSTEKKSLKDSFKQEKNKRISELTEQFGSKQIALGVWAGEKIVAIQTQQAAQKIDKAELSKMLNMDWPSWLERQAQAGDEAAKSALRGIRYREQRTKTKARSGFEGEDLGDLKSYQGNSIGGDLKFKLSNAQIDIDHHRQLITYKDQDGKSRLIDSGPRIDVIDRDDQEAIREGLELSAQKFGGEVYITGDPEFRERAAREAARMNIRVADKDLGHIVEHEKKIIAQEQQGKGLSR